MLGVGEDEKKRNLTWCTSGDAAAQSAQLAPTSQVKDGVFPDTARSFAAVSGEAAAPGQSFHHVTFDNLAPATSYTYRIGSQDAWLGTHTFTTPAAGPVEFFSIGDAQIGSSGDAARDAQGWSDTLALATEMFPQARLLVSAGDQVESSGNETQYLGYTGPEQLGHTPTIGNHDVGSARTYGEHDNLPNYDADATRNHWWAQDGVLFLHLNTNNRDYAAHRAWLEKAVAEAGDGFHHRVIVMHHSIYSTASHSLSSDTVERRTNFPPIFGDLGIDLVLMGHDHVYARTHVMTDGQPRSEGRPSEVTLKQREVMYVTANSSSGSKFYAIRDNEFPYVSYTNQERVPNFSHVTVTECSSTVTTYRTTDRAVGTPSPTDGCSIT